MELKNKRWSDDEFYQKRKEVLSTWPMGAEVDLEEAIEYNKSLADELNLVKAVHKARKNGKIILGVTIGLATIEQMLEHMKTVEEAGIDLIAPIVDGYTKKGKYDLAQRGIEQSIKEGRSLLNGYPIVCHGVKGARRIREEVHVPFIYGGGDEEPMLQAEIALAAGWAGIMSHDIAHLFMYGKDYPVEKWIQNHQYHCRLAAYYHEHGVESCVWDPGTGCDFEPPGMRIALSLFSALTAAEQGVKHMLKGLAALGNPLQDIAGFRVFGKLLSKYLVRFGYDDVDVILGSSPDGGAWPRTHDLSVAHLTLEVSEAVLAGVDVLRFKTPDEAIAIPTKEANISAINVVRYITAILGKSRLPSSPELSLEEEMTALEASAIVDKALELGDGDVAIGSAKALEQGVVDCAYTPYKYAKKQVMVARDAYGALRYMEHGNIPLPKQVAEYHREKIEEGKRVRGFEKDIDMIIHDVTFISKPER